MPNDKNATPITVRLVSSIDMTASASGQWKRLIVWDNLRLCVFAVLRRGLNYHSIYL
jgi:hypothetical protein